MRINQNISQFEKLLRRAKRKCFDANESIQDIFKFLENIGLDPSIIYTDAENANNVEEAIFRYLFYDEYSALGICVSVGHSLEMLVTSQSKLKEWSK